MVDRKNYFVASAAEFRAIPSKWVRALLRVGKKIRLGNRRYLLDHVSKVDEMRGDYFTGGYHARSFSAYWVSADGSELIRVSDHWCLGANRRWATSDKAKRCPNVKSCLWWLSGKPHAVESDGFRLVGGIVRFRDMRSLLKAAPSRQ